MSRAAFFFGSGISRASGAPMVGDLTSSLLEGTHRTLICCGYGWSDKGINIRPGQWLRDAKENRIVIFHGGPVEHVTQNRFWYWRWKDHAEAGKVQIIPKWLSECTVPDLEPFFDR